MIKFRGVEIPGPHMELETRPPEYVGLQRHFFGLGGTTEIRSKGGGRQISVEMWLSKVSWNQVKADKLYDFLDDLDLWAHERRHATLEMKTDHGDRKFKNCTFLGCTMLPFPGHRTASPLRDEARTLFTYTDDESKGGAWFCRIRLEWFQTDVKATRAGTVSLAGGL